MPVRTIDTRLGRLIERRRAATRPGRPVPAGPATPPEDDGGRAERSTPLEMATWPLHLDAMTIATAQMRVQR